MAGAVYSVRPKGNVIALWNMTVATPTVFNTIDGELRDAYNSERGGQDLDIEYRPHPKADVSISEEPTPEAANPYATSPVANGNGTYDAYANGASPTYNPYANPYNSPQYVQAAYGNPYATVANPYGNPYVNNYGNQYAGWR